MFCQRFEIKSDVHGLDKGRHNFREHVPKAGVVSAVCRFKNRGHLLCDVSLHLLVEGDEVVALLLPEVDLSQRPGMPASSQLLPRVLAENLLCLNIIYQRQASSLYI